MPASNPILHFISALLFTAALFISGCGGGTTDIDTTDIVTNALTSDPLVQEFNTLYPKAENLIAVDLDQSGKATWTSDVDLHENRFRLYMEFEADIDIKANTLTRTGEPMFYLVQNPDPTGGTDGSGHFKSAEFGKSEWEKIVSAKGKLTPVLRMLK